jgi:cytochrome c oxidase subunit 2
MSKLQGLLFALATLALVVVATALFSRDWLPPLASNRIAIDSAIGASLLVTGLVFIATNLLLAWFGFRYQDAEGAKATYWHDNPKLEWSWTLATAAVMLGFMFNSLSLWADIQQKAPEDAMLVEVTGQQFRWVIRYPGPDGVLGRTDPTLVDVGAENYIGLDLTDPAATDDIMRVNDLHLIEGRPVRIQIRSTDVIHSFFLPQFRVKQDAMPGLTVENWFVPEKSGDFEIACAEHCGLGHYRMRGFVHVVSAEEHAQALAE